VQLLNNICLVTSGMLLDLSIWYWFCHRLYSTNGFVAFHIFFCAVCCGNCNEPSTFVQMMITVWTMPDLLTYEDVIMSLIDICDCKNMH